MQHTLTQIAKKNHFFIGIQNIKDTEWLLKEKGDKYVCSNLTEKEYEIFQKFKTLKRKLDWLSGRMAAKQAFASYQNSMYHSGQNSNISVLNIDGHAPFIADNPDLTVSISHSYERAIAVVAPFKIGIDIEKIETRPLSLAHYFCSKEELSIFNRHQNNKDEIFTRFWSRKEAVSKFLQLGGKLNFKHVNTVNNKVYVTKEMIHLISEKCDGYWISIAV